MSGLKTCCKFDDSLKFVRSLGPLEGLAMLVILGKIGFEESFQVFA